MSDSARIDIRQQNEQLALATHLTVFSLSQSNSQPRKHLRRLSGIGYLFSKVCVCVKVAVAGVGRA